MNHESHMPADQVLTEYTEQPCQVQQGAIKMYSQDRNRLNSIQPDITSNHYQTQSQHGQTLPDMSAKFYQSQIPAKEAHADAQGRGHKRQEISTYILPMSL